MRVRVGDRNLACTITGEGPAIAWIHAFPLGSDLFRAQLALPGYRNVAVDLPGFGESSDQPPMTSIDEMGRVVVELMQALNETRFTVAGVSMGGYIALSVLRAAPERIRALILMDTRETADSDEARATRFRQIDEIEAKGTAPLMTAMLEKLVARYATDAVRNQVMAMMRAASPEGVSAALRAMAARPDSTADIRRHADLPILVIVGEDDVITPPDEAVRLASVASGTLVRVEGAGHLACLEQSDFVNGAIARFLEEEVR